MYKKYQQTGSHKVCNVQPTYKSQNLALLKRSRGFLCAITISLQTHAQLPQVIETALNQANINSDEMSLVIRPVNPILNTQHSSHTISSRLPTAVIPKNQKIKETVITDVDALPSEQLQQTPIVLYSSATHDEPKSSNLITEDSGTLKSAAESVDNNSIQPSLNTSATYNTSATDVKYTFPIRHFSDVPRTPASTMKLIPTFVALDLLGPNFVWFTQVYHSGFISAGTLYGDLIIKGSGDPKLTHQRLNQILYQVKQAGVRHIKGDIIIDSSVFHEVSKDPAAFDKDPLRPYNASPDGFLVNFSSIEINAIPLQHESQTTTAKLFYKPMLADYHLPENITLNYNGSCTSARSTLAPIWQSKGLTYNKQLPISCSAHSFYIAFPDAKEFANKVVKQKWLDLGNTVTGSVKFLNLGHTLSGKVINTEAPLKSKFGNYYDMDVDKDSDTYLHRSLASIPSSPLAFVSYPSLPLSQQIYDINHFSNNVMTEQVTLTLPLYIDPESLATHHYLSIPAIKTQVQQQSDYEKALSVINRWWQKNLQTAPPFMTNGSGLCRDCHLTADNLAELLEFAYQHKDFQTYVHSLGIAGVNGTIAQHAERLPDSAAIGRAWIKTGTLQNVTSMAGYVQGQSGQDYVVVAIINRNNNDSQPLDTYDARVVLDTMLDWTAQQ